jgi:hypothetical protein
VPQHQPQVAQGRAERLRISHPRRRARVPLLAPAVIRKEQVRTVTSGPKGAGNPNLRPKGLTW